MVGLRYGQAPRRGRNSTSLLGTHDRKVKPGDKEKILPQVFPKDQYAELKVEVPENYGGNFPLYLIKVSLRTGWAALPQVTLPLPPAFLSLSCSAFLSILIPKQNVIECERLTKCQFQ